MDTKPLSTDYRHTRSAAPMEPRAPLSDRYELRGVLGRGAWAEVHDAWDLKLNRPVAIKLLQPGIAARPENRLRFETEARAAATLNSRHIVVVHDIGEHDGLQFIVMERLPGVSLADHIARGPLPPAFVHTVLDDVLAALAVAHDAGILHRDVKPGNILFTAAGEPKLADFGLAKTTGAVHTMTGQIVGTMAYLSPNRLTSQPATAADDLYAVGVVGYEALTGQRPFPQEELGAVAHAILHESPPPLAALRPDVPPVLAISIERAISRDPAQQFHWANEMRAALAGALPPNHRVRPPTLVMAAPPLRPASTALKRKLWAAAIFAAFVLAVILLAVSPSTSSPPQPATTTTPLPPPTTTTTPMISSSTPAPPPPPPPAPVHPGRKHKGGHGGD
jgi:serine/threonine protein kinase